jgi:hypothetical protein
MQRHRSKVVAFVPLGVPGRLEDPDRQELVQASYMPDLGWVAPVQQKRGVTGGTVRTKSEGRNGVAGGTSQNFPKTRPEMAKIIERVGPRYLTSSSGLALRALRDLQHAKDVGRLTFDDPAVAIACTGGALLGVLHLGLLQQEPSAIDHAADELAVNLLRMFGLADSDAREGAGPRCRPLADQLLRAPSRAAPPTRQSDAAISAEQGVDKARL